MRHLTNFVLIAVVMTAVMVSSTVVARHVDVPEFAVQPISLLVGGLAGLAVARRVWPGRTGPTWRWLVSIPSGAALLLLWNYLGP
jgi:hypothetical protein